MEFTRNFNCFHDHEDREHDDYEDVLKFTGAPMCSFSGIV